MKEHHFQLNLPTTASLFLSHSTNAIQPIYSARLHKAIQDSQEQAPAGANMKRQAFSLTFTVLFLAAGMILPLLLNILSSMNIWFKAVNVLNISWAILYLLSNYLSPSCLACTIMSNLETDHFSYYCFPQLNLVVFLIYTVIWIKQKCHILSKVNETDWSLSNFLCILVNF